MYACLYNGNNHENMLNHACTYIDAYLHICLL